MNTPTRLAAALALLCTAAWTGPAAADDFPSQPIQLYVAFAPGGGADINARIVARKASEILGRSIVVVNRGGAGGIVAAKLAAAARPDGYTLLQVTITHAIAEGVYTGLPYRLLADFAPVAATGSTRYMLAVNGKVPANDVRQFIDYAKSAAHPVTSGTSGNNGPTDLATKLFARSAGIEIQGIPYKGANEAVTDLVAGRVDMSFIVLPAAMPLIKAGQIKALGVTGLQRSALAPDFPTVDESGLKGFEASTWFGIVAPAGTPDPVLDKLHDAFARALQDPDTQKQLIQGGIEAEPRSRQAFAGFLKGEVDRWTRIVDETGVPKQILN
ncbi:tripartite tricarboxylate transporter substrate binding protein [Pigmentiphaga soli]|uniref:Tripartite tricarboxylate transporter substrate binding protein n=1 Tax=Pigmentiphaga soli TaxID=1007095 RepID=A0ABP8GZM6_9BURK